MRSGRLLACSAIEQTTEEDMSALEGGGGLCRLQPPRDAGGAIAARAEGRRSTTGRRERRAQRWRRGSDAGEGVPVLGKGARETVRIILVQVEA
jgi:hypothetical protein